MKGVDVEVDRVLDLAEAVCDDAASSAECAELDSLVLADETVRRNYWDYCQMHVMLEMDLRLNRALKKVHAQDRFDTADLTPWESDALAGVTSSVMPSHSSTVFGLFSGTLHGTIGFFSQEVPFALLIATVITGLGLLMGSFVYVSHHEQIADTKLPPSLPSQAAIRSQAEYVGRITGMVDCKGSEVRGQRSGESGRRSETDKFQIPNPKSLVSLGDSFALSSGLLEITYDTGAKVILQAPCAYKVESRDGGFLSVGKLTARLEKKVQEASSLKLPHPLSPAAFVVRTPMAVVTDLGTEFGVEVGPTGVVETCVFDGRVRVDAIGRNGVNAAMQELSRGEAIRILPREYVIRPAVMKSEQFVRHLPRVGTIRDNFEVKRNYLTDGTSGTVWSGILNVDKALRLDTLPIDIDGQRQTGLLTIAVTKDSWAGWAQPHRDRTWNNAPYLFVNVAKGDFEARVHIQSQTAGPWSVAGLMVRREDGGFASVNCNRFDSTGCTFATRGNWTDVDTDNSVPAEADKGIALRLVRMGDTFMASGSIDNGQTWKALDWGEGKNSMGGTVLRLPEMIGTVQVGLWYGTFNPAEGEASFQNFIIERRK